MWISRYFVEFIFFAFLGWVWETIFCTFKSSKWEKRGFLYGPICPIYGVGGIGGTALVEILQNNGFPSLLWWQVLLIAFFFSILLEYSTSWVLEKLFHAYWWDYSDVPLNINGRVCFPASCGFAAAGLLVVYILIPACQWAAAYIDPILMELLAMILLAIFTIDMTLTISALTDFDKKVMQLDEEINDHMTEVIENFYHTTGELHIKAINRVKGFRNPHLSVELLKKLREKFKENTPKIKGKIFK